MVPRWLSAGYSLAGKKDQSTGGEPVLSGDFLPKESGENWKKQKTGGSKKLGKKTPLFFSFLFLPPGFLWLLEGGGWKKKKRSPPKKIARFFTFSHLGENRGRSSMILHHPPTKGGGGGGGGGGQRDRATLTIPRYSDARALQWSSSGPFRHSPGCVHRCEGSWLTFDRNWLFTLHWLLQPPAVGL